MLRQQTAASNTGAQMPDNDITAGEIVLATNLASAAYAETALDLEIELARNGWTAISAAELGFSPTEALANFSGGQFSGLYEPIVNMPGAGAAGFVARRGDTLAISFRGTDSLVDLLVDDIVGGSISWNIHYDKFAPLLARFWEFYQENKTAGYEFSRIIVAGHSLGGAMVEKFMEQYARIFPEMVGLTIGSPGVSISENGFADRLINIEHTDDPVVDVSLLDVEFGTEIVVDRMEPSLSPSEHFRPAYLDTVSLLYGSWRNGVFYPAVFASELTSQGDAFRTSIWTLNGETVNGRIGNDAIFSRDGNDTVYGGNGRDLIDAGSGNDRVFGGIGNDLVHSWTGLDIVYGGDGNDTLFGGGLFDILKGEIGDDNLYGGDGVDAVYGDEGNDLLKGEVGNDVLRGGIGNDSIFGDGNDDSLFGEADSDTLQGGNENDTLNGGTGRDTLFGEKGADRFMFTSLPVLGELPDRIMDYRFGNTGVYSASERDVIDVSALVGAAYASGAGQPASALVRLVTSSTTGMLLLQVDRDGRGTNYGWQTTAQLGDMPSTAMIDVILKAGGLTPDISLLAPFATGNGNTAAWTISPASPRVTETEGRVVTFTVTRPEGGAAQTVYASTVQTHGSVNNGDYYGLLNKVITFAEGSRTATVSVILRGDTLAEPSETFGLIVQTVRDPVLDRHVASSAFTIMDNDTSNLSNGFTNGNDFVVLTEGLVTDTNYDLGAGFDTVVVDYSRATISLGITPYFLQAHGPVDYTVYFRLSNSEKLIAYMGSANDQLQVNSEIVSFLYGGGGNDDLYGGANGYMFGGSGNDHLTKDSAGIGLIDGGAGIDELDWNAESETIGQSVFFYQGSTSLQRQSDSSIITGIERIGLRFGSGNDFISYGFSEAWYSYSGFNGGYFLNGGSGIDTAILDFSTIIGPMQLFADPFIGLDSTFYMKNMTSGNQEGMFLLSFERLTVIGGQGDDLIGGTTRPDFLLGAAGDDYMIGYQSDEGIRGSLTDADTLDGGLGRDSIYGELGNDSIVGGGGNDFLVGGAGVDTLFGGVGSDIFVFDKPLQTANIDQLKDYDAASDIIYLESSVFSRLSVGELASVAFRSNATGIAGDVSDRIIYEKDTGKLYFDADGTGSIARLQFAVLSPSLTLTHNDFMVI